MTDDSKEAEMPLRLVREKRLGGKCSWWRMKRCRHDQMNVVEKRDEDVVEEMYLLC